MARLYIGNLDPRVTARELEDEFRTFGVLRRSVVLSPQILRFVCLVLEIHACLLV
jgi:RNA recognition motif-containing protein